MHNNLINILNIFILVVSILWPITLLLKIIITKSSKRRKVAIIELTVLVILFSIFYMFKIGDFMLKDKDGKSQEKVSKNIDNKNLDKTNENVKDRVNETKDKVTKNIYDKNTSKVLEEKKYKIESIDGVTYVDGVLIVNKTYGLPSDYKPNDTYTPVNDLNYCTTCINKDAYEKYLEMESDALSLGLKLWIQSGYRSYNLQSELYSGYIERDGIDIANTYSAKPGHSEHQTGLAFDLNTITDEFANTAEGKWVNENAYRYGFILRYPKEKETITGYKYEPWHLRYVGVDLATLLYNEGNWITLEEHFNITSTYDE